MSKLINVLRASARRTKFAIWIDKYVYKTRTKAFIELLCMPFGLFKMFFLFLSKKTNHKFKYNLAITAIVKNEAQYIREWIEYHLMIGIEKFYIYDNDSTDKILEVLGEYIENDIVEYKKIIGKNRQNDAYNDSLNKNRNSVKYMAFIDIDEFINTHDISLVSYLDESLSDAKTAGLVLNWKIFGSAHLNKKTQEMVLERFLYSSDETFVRNKHVKTICKPKQVLGIINPHYCVYLSNRYAVSVDGKKSTGPYNDNVKFYPICINHYFCKSYEEFVEKRARGKADSLGIRDVHEFEEHDVNDFYDDGMLKYVSQIRGVH